MKRCPQCNRVEADDALVFCRTDGVALINDSGSFDSQTAVFGSGSIPTEIETSLLPHATSPDINRNTGPTTVLPPPQLKGNTRELTKPKRRGLSFAAIGLTLAIAGALGYIYWSRTPTTAIESIAVLPFHNKSTDADTEYLSDGLAESLIFRLSQLPNLKVSPTSSVIR